MNSTQTEPTTFWRIAVTGAPVSFPRELIHSGASRQDALDKAETHVLCDCPDPAAVSLAIVEISDEPALKATPTEADLVEWYQADLPSRGGRHSMPIPQTWARYQAWAKENETPADVEAFHALLWSLEDSVKISIWCHDEPGTLPDEESAVCPLDPRTGGLQYLYSVI